MSHAHSNNSAAPSVGAPSEEQAQRERCALASGSACLVCGSTLTLRIIRVPGLDLLHCNHCGSEVPRHIPQCDRQTERLRDACERAQRYIRGQKKSEWSTGWLWRDECLNAIEAALSPNDGDEGRPASAESSTPKIT